MPRALGFRTNTANVDRLAGYLNELSVEVRSSEFIGSVLSDIHSQIAESFDITMDTQAKVDPMSFHHVYEWGQLGDPDGRLWRDVLTGRGRNRIATFEWRASKVPVPTSDTQANVHIFVWKAPVMEYSTEVTIAPKLSKVLAFDVDGETVFTTQPVHVNPGGEATTGAFTQAYTDFFGGEEGLAIVNSAAAKVNKDLASVPLKTGTIRVASSNIAYAEGKAAAKAFLGAKKTNYIAQAAARRNLNG